MTSIELFSTSSAAARRDEIRMLLERSFGDFSEDDWAHTLGGWHIVAADEGEIVSHAAVVARTLLVDGQAFRTGYVEGVATAPPRQGQGLGSLVMAELGQVIERQFEFGALSTGRHSFYEWLGWQRWRGPTFVRTGDQLTRTPDEDDGVMVLRFGPSAKADLEAPIVCETRPGDDW